MRPLIILVLLSPLWTTNSMGQECLITLQGIILDHATHEPMEYAAIGIVETSSGALTDSTGLFVIHGICKGRIILALNILDAILCGHIFRSAGIRSLRSI